MLDRIDQSIRADRLAKRNRIQRPTVGDFICFASGETERFSYDMEHSMQTTPGGAFYIGESGQASFSGSLNPPVPTESLTLTSQVKEGTFWFFHHGSPGAGRRVDITLPCRVYSCSAPYRGFVRL